MAMPYFYFFPLATHFLTIIRFQFQMYGCHLCNFILMCGASFLTFGKLAVLEKLLSYSQILSFSVSLYQLSYLIYAFYKVDELLWLWSSQYIG